MGLRDTLRSSPATGIAVAAVLLLAAIVIFVRSGAEAPGPTSWYYDIESQEKVKGGATPPTSTAVAARVFACGDCEGELFVGYLEKSNPDPAPPSTDRPTDPAMHILVAAVPAPGEQPQWRVGATPEARAILASPGRQCGDRYRECLP